ncbi:lipid-A-disaccharide kinase [Sulfuritortus calidifontis]|uniref:Tetraacyldisaccharide 4'-kinase n=1 Tax=Sulfuritortus calidifontis TaxID=1914471 RepID=A0A4R3K0U5_9PROT|nr:tetraacyldisaccharide 4'-kinase [Sulfuritortus calidifontis]TCS73969.1 lipid-A-disaccharide kinase [Sulfuritortus calidifontis]
MERLVRCWYRPCPWRYLLTPVSLLFFLAVWLRRLAYRAGWLGVERLPVPVVVVGNIAVGGTGKTPLTIWLAEQLRQAGWHPGIVSRGYGGRRRDAAPVQPDSDPEDVGDEPVLLAQRTGCPVWVGRRRAEAARQLLAFHPEVDVILADDGLQHYALARDVELVVVDGERGFGNGWLLPAGPLREPRSRLDSVTAVVVNGGQILADLAAPQFAMTLSGRRFWRLGAPQTVVEAGHFAGRAVEAVAGIGNPARFFRTLADLGIRAQPHALPDHHRYRPQDLPAGTVLMTEKDAVKCAAFEPADAWVLRIDAEVGAGLKNIILEKIGSPDGRQTA